MKLLYGLIISICLYGVVCSAAEQAEKVPQNAAYQWYRLAQEIEHDTVGKYEARRSLKALRPQLDRYFADHKGAASPKKRWVFPLEGYGPQCIDKYYRVHGFDFLSPVRHRDHPAYDLFIRDRNRDCLDDRTGRPVRILSVTDGVVVSRSIGWVSVNDRRGGNCVWVYDPYTKGLFYYAHMHDVFADIGDIVAPGDILGTVGRTGSNAYRKRSPTHLHIMYLRYPDNGYPYPRRFYNDLLKCRLVKRKPAEALPALQIEAQKLPVKPLHEKALTFVVHSVTAPAAGD
jgi:murein DD-endopeptidase MepM/ murein hydrolase activator NlpD